MRARAAQIPRAVAKLPRSRGSAVVVHATKNGSESEANDHPEDWELKYLYDGACTVGKSLVALLKSKRGHEKIWFEDIAAKDFNPDNNKGITFEEAMDTIHVITRKDDKIFTGMEALTL